MHGISNLASPLAEAAAASRARIAALVGLYAAFVSLAGTFVLPPLDRDEARFVQATAQMLETDDFVSMRFQEAERNKKPAGIHWLQAASVSTFSSAEARAVWAYRLPSALAAVAAAVFTALLGARLFDRSVGALAGLLLASAPVFAGEATIAKTDAALLAAVCAAQFCFATIAARLHERETPPTEAFLGLWIALGAGILIKGPIAPLIVCIAACAVVWKSRDLAWRDALKPALGAAILAAMVAPWAFAIGAATEGRFFSEAIGRDMLGKIGAAQERHAGPPGYHLALLPLLFWPAIALAPKAVAAGVRQIRAKRTDWRFVFLFAWIFPNWAVFELASTKLPHYTLPLYPALAILVGWAATRPLESTPGLNRFGAGLYGLVGLLVAAAIGGAVLHHNGTGVAAAAIAAGAFVLGTGVAAAAFWRGDMARGLAVSIPLGAALAWTLLQVILPGLDALNVSGRLAAGVRGASLHAIADGAPATIVAGYYEPSAVFLLGTATILAGPAEAAAAAATGDHVAPRAVAAEARVLDAFLAEAATRGLDLTPIEEIVGVNYSNGDPVALTLYRLDPPVDE